MAPEGYPPYASPPTPPPGQPPWANDSRPPASGWAQPAAPPARPARTAGPDGFQVPLWAMLGAAAGILLVLLGALMTGIAGIDMAETDEEEFDEEGNDGEAQLAWGFPLRGVGIVVLAGTVLALGLLVSNPMASRLVLVAAGLILLSGGITFGTAGGFNPFLFGF